MNDLKRLSRFLIFRFLLIIVITSLAEAAMLWILNRTLIRWMILMVFGTTQVDNVNINSIILTFFLVLISVILSLATRIIPSGTMYRQSNILIGILNRYISGLMSLPESANGVYELSLGSRLLLWLMIMATMALVIAPYAVAAVIYARIVVREFARIEDAEVAERDRYERSRNLMLTDIAHDLRTPMTTVAGYAAALEDGLIDDDRRSEVYAAIRAKSDRMNDLINLLFDYVRLDSEGFTLSREDMDICELIRETVAEQYQDIEDAGMGIDARIPDEVIPAAVDRVQFTRVLTNLITNAIRHNAPGTDIGVYVIRDGSHTDICVADNGTPIDPKQAATIFEPFVTGDASRQAGTGTGLGLSIAHRIIEMHGFELSLIRQADIPPRHPAYGSTKMFRIRI